MKKIFVLFHLQSDTAALISFACLLIFLASAIGSTHTVNPVSIRSGFCNDFDDDGWFSDDTGSSSKQKGRKLADDRPLACLDDITNDIEMSSVTRDPWENFPALKSLLRDRMDWDSHKPMIRIDFDQCNAKGKLPCNTTSHMHIGPKDVQAGDVFSTFNKLWREEGEPLSIKRDQLIGSFWESSVPNALNRTWEYDLVWF